MPIAHPIHDVVFECRLDDEKVSRLMLSALPGRHRPSPEPRAAEVPRPDR